MSVAVPAGDTGTPTRINVHTGPSIRNVVVPFGRLWVHVPSFPLAIPRVSFHVQRYSAATAQDVQVWCVDGEWWWDAAIVLLKGLGVFHT